jgi:8-hydroxy-5-deazaflavin:NADPH oxidoreductase
LAARDGPHEVAPMKVGILGSGDVGRSLAKGFVAAGHSVKIGSRSGRSAPVAEWVETSGGSGSAGTLAEAAKFGDLVVLATLGVAVGEAITAAGVEHFERKVVIDVTNPLAFSAGGSVALARGFTTSNGEEVQRLLPEARVVKAFNIVGNSLFYRPALPGGPPDMYLCGNDAAAKGIVTEILHDFGWPSVIDIGGIEGSRELESLCILWVKTAVQLQNFEIAYRVLRK